MADCSASGTAIDRVVQSAVASALNQGGGDGAVASSAVAASAATRALGDFFSGTAATARGPSVAGGVLGSVLGSDGRVATAAEGAIVAGGPQLMPLAPMEAIGGGRSAVADGASSRLDDAWAASTTSGHAAAPRAPMAHRAMRSQAVPFHHAPPQMMIQQQQMMMMQQMQMQQQQMAAMVQYQKQQQQQQQTIESQKKSAANISEADSTAVDDDVATVSEEEQLHHEGVTEDASIERLARAWRDAEAEFAEEFGEDEYDVSDMGGLYSEEHREGATGADASGETAEAQYEFSEASRTYGCLRTISTDAAPRALNYPDNLYERGLRHFDDGDISSAILCFESTLRNVEPDHADAWRMLGRCHTENDEDQRAIACWLRSLERDPFSPETLLALGVAYVNELDHERAVETLRGWVAHHPLYAGCLDAGKRAEEEDPYGSGDAEEGPGRRMRPSAVAEMRDVERLLLCALDHDRTADAAADVYEALGVVYNVSRDYDAAADAFRRAIDFRPDDYQLRNKLGATLANGNRSEEALPSYHAALRVKPKYARAWANLAIANSNLHNYDEAARCYLQTLSLNPEGRHVWSYLRIALTCEERWDLLPLAAAQNLSAFHDHFDFVEY